MIGGVCSFIIRQVTIPNRAREVKLDAEEQAASRTATALPFDFQTFWFHTLI
jgi:hypothetical protein